MDREIQTPPRRSSRTFFRNNCDRREPADFSQKTAETPILALESGRSTRAHIVRQKNCQVLRRSTGFAAMKFSGWLILCLVLLSGCTSVNTHLWTKSDLRGHKNIYVETAANDSAGIDALIAAELQKLGFNASSGVRTMRPDNTELIISYDGQWEWDFRLYLIQLNLTVRDAKNDQQLATGRIVHPGVTSKSPEAMVHDVVAPLFGSGK